MRSFIYGLLLAFSLGAMAEEPLSSPGIPKSRLIQLQRSISVDALCNGIRNTRACEMFVASAIFTCARGLVQEQAVQEQAVQEHPVQEQAVQEQAVQEQAVGPDNAGNSPNHLIEHTRASSTLKLPQVEAETFFTDCVVESADLIKKHNSIVASPGAAENSTMPRRKPSASDEDVSEGLSSIPPPPPPSN